MDSKDIRDLNKIYMEAVYGGGKKVEKKDTRLTVTAADKKANTKAYQNYKAGNKAYKAADHLGEGKAESPEAEEEKDKKDDNLAGAPNKKGKKAKRWWDDDGDGKGYEDGEVDGKFPKKKEVKEGKNGDCVSKSEKGDHNCAKKVCHEKYGIGNCIEGQHTILEDGTVGHYDVEFEEYIVENCPVEELEILVTEMHSHSAKKKVSEAIVQTYGTKGKLKKELKSLGKGFDTLKGKNIKKADAVAEEVLDEKEGYKTVAAVIDYDRSKKGTDDATYDSMHGDKKGAKKERDYAAFERGKMKKDDPNWKHKKGSTSESVEVDKYIETVQKVKEAESEADIERWSVLESSGKFTAEEIEAFKEVDRLGKIEESEKLAQKAYDRAQKLGAQRRSSSNPRGIGKGERAGYNLAQAQRSRNTDAATQGGSQTGGGPKSFGYAKNKSNPVKSKSIGDTGATGHYRKRDEKVTSKSGKTTRYKMKFRDRMDAPVSRRQELKDPKKNPKHTDNK